MRENTLYRVYVHRVISEDLYYVGMTNQPKRRFKNSEYKTCSLRTYLNKDIPLTRNPNIETLVIPVDYDYHKAKVIEDTLIEFYKGIGRVINRQGSGDNCYTIEYRKKRYDENRDEIMKKQKEWRGQNKEKVCEAKKRYRERNREYLKEKSKNYYYENKEKVLQYQREYRNTHVEELRAKRKARYEKRHGIM